MIASLCNLVRGPEILRPMNCMSFSLLRCRMYAILEMDRNLLKIQLVNGGGGGSRNISRVDADDEPGHGTRDEVKRSSWHPRNRPSHGGRNNEGASL